MAVMGRSAKFLTLVIAHHIPTRTRATTQSRILLLHSRYLLGGLAGIQHLLHHSALEMIDKRIRQIPEDSRELVNTKSLVNLGSY